MKWLLIIIGVIMASSLILAGELSDKNIDGIEIESYDVDGTTIFDKIYNTIALDFESNFTNLGDGRVKQEFYLTNKLFLSSSIDFSTKVKIDYSEIYFNGTEYNLETLKSPLRMGCFDYENKTMCPAIFMKISNTKYKQIDWSDVGIQGGYAEAYCEPSLDLTPNCYVDLKIDNLAINSNSKVIIDPTYYNQTDGMPLPFPNAGQMGMHLIDEGSPLDGLWINDHSSDVTSQFDISDGSLLSQFNYTFMNTLQLGVTGNATDLYVLIDNNDHKIFVYNTTLDNYENITLEVIDGWAPYNQWGLTMNETNFFTFQKYDWWNGVPESFSVWYLNGSLVYNHSKTISYGEDLEHIADDSFWFIDSYTTISRYNETTNTFYDTINLAPFGIDVASGVTTTKGSNGDDLYIYCWGDKFLYHISTTDPDATCYWMEGNNLVIPYDCNYSIIYTEEEVLPY